MSIAGMTTTSLCSRLAVIRELQRDGNVLRLAQRLDHQLKRVFVLADDAKLVALDPNLRLGGDILDPLAEVSRDVVGDPRVEQDLDLAAAFADGLGVAGLEELGRQLAPRSLLTQHLHR